MQPDNAEPTTDPSGGTVPQVDGAQHADIQHQNNSIGGLPPLWPGLQSSMHLASGGWILCDPWPAFMRKDAAPSGPRPWAGRPSRISSLWPCCRALLARVQRESDPQFTMATSTSTSTSSSTTKTSKTALVITSFPSVPLTTTFTAPGTDCGGIYIPRKPGIFIIDDQTSCLPTSFSTSNSAFFYSPGIACPSGYWTACHDTTGVASITTVTCCPIVGDITLSCVPNPLSLSEVWESLFCTWIAPRSPGTTITVTKSDDGRTSTVLSQVQSAGGINAYGVRMVYQASDLDTATSTSSTLSTTTTPPTATPETSNPPTEAPSTDSGGLSTAAKASIGTIIPLVVLLAALGAWFFFRRRKRQQQQQQTPDSSALSSLPTQQHEHMSQGGLEYYNTAVAPGSSGGVYKAPGEEQHYYYGGQQQQQQYPQEMLAGWEPPELRYVESELVDLWPPFSLSRDRLGATVLPELLSRHIHHTGN